MKLKKTLLLSILIYLPLLSVSFRYPIQKEAFIWGINGHPISQKAYSNATWDDQIKYLKDLQVNYYRYDVLLNQEGYIKYESWATAFLGKLKSNNLHSLLVVKQVGFKDMNYEDSYKLSFEQGENFCKKYNKYLTVIEIGNEEDDDLILSSGYDGTKEYHYDLKKADKLMAQVKGFADGVKSVNPAIKISMSLGWVHFYYLELLKNYNINYDIIGYHWYSSMGDITNVKAPYGDILSKIKKKYKKEIWITEFNTYGGSFKAGPEKQDAYIKKSIAKILDQGIVNGLFFYELFDQPVLRNPLEQHYGLISNSGTNASYSKKSAYHQYKKIVEEYKNRNYPSK